MNGKPTSMATHGHCRRATILSDFYPVKKRGQILAWFYMAIPVGSALGYVLGGAVAASSIGDLGAHLLGIHAGSWRWAFILVAPVGMPLTPSTYCVEYAPIVVSAFGGPLRAGHPAKQNPYREAPLWAR